MDEVIVCNECGQESPNISFDGRCKRDRCASIEWTDGLGKDLYSKIGCRKMGVKRALYHGTK